MEELKRLERSIPNEVSSEYFDAFGMIPYGSEATPSVNLVADTHNFSVHYHAPANSDAEGANQMAELTSADLELAEVRRNGETDKDTKQNEAKHFNTIDEAIDFLGFGMFQIKIILLIGFAVTADATEMLALSILAPAVACQWGLSSTDQAVLTMSVFGGMLVGASCWGKLSDKFGRRNCIVLFALCAAYCEAMCAFAPRFEWVVLLHVLVGFSVGGTPQTGTLLSEFLPSRWRAASLIGLQLFWAVGGCFEALLALLVMEPLGWRALMLFNALPLLLFLSTATWLPESVRFLVLSGRINEAQATLDSLARANRKPCVDLLNIVNLQPLHLEKPPSTESSVDAERPPDVSGGQRGRLRDLLGRVYRRVTLNLWVVWFLSAFSYYGIVFLTTTLLQLNDACHAAPVPVSSTSATTDVWPAADGDTPPCRLACVTLTAADYQRIVWTTVAEFPAIIVVLFVVDRWGRRNTLACHYGAFAFVVLLLNICMDRTWTTVTLFAARAFVTGAHQTLHVYTPESYPTALRATGVGSAASCGRVGAMLTPLVAQLLAGANQLNVAFALYAIGGVCATGASLMLPFETSGRQLAEHVNCVASINDSSVAKNRLASPSRTPVTTPLDSAPGRDECDEAFEQVLYPAAPTSNAQYANDSYNAELSVPSSLQRRNAPTNSRHAVVTQQVVSLS